MKFDLKKHIHTRIQHQSQSIDVAGKNDDENKENKIKLNDKHLQKKNTKTNRLI